MPPTVHVAPESDRAIEEAVTAAGGRIGGIDEADALVWLDSNPDSFPGGLPEAVRWVQLPSAGVERWLDRIDGARAWTSAAGAYGRPVAEHALMLMLAGARQLAACARATSWNRPPLVPLEGATVAIVGAGGIGRALIELLAPLRVEVLAVTRRGRDGTIPVDRLDEIWPRADHVVIAAPATADTTRLVGPAELEAMRGDAWLVNIARGSLVDTSALVSALSAGAIGGAALDVTDPEPLPADHLLLKAPNLLVVPHVGSATVRTRHKMTEIAVDNLLAALAGEPMPHQAN
jgi:phosphoglycerate dehydrogenase-like enzyme